MPYGSESWQHAMAERLGVGSEPASAWSPAPLGEKTECPLVTLLPLLELSGKGRTWFIHQLKTAVPFVPK